MSFLVVLKCEKKIPKKFSGYVAKTETGEEDGSQK